MERGTENYRNKPKRAIPGRAVLLGVLLAVVCHVLPDNYQSACRTVLKVASLTCGAGG